MFHWPWQYFASFAGFAIVLTALTQLRKILKQLRLLMDEFTRFLKSPNECREAWRAFTADRPAIPQKAKARRRKLAGAGDD
jgi:hypothetical protein